MKSIYKSLLVVLLSSVALSGCKNLNTKVSINKQELPSAFASSEGNNNIASINWKEYFADSTLTELIDVAVKNNLDAQIALQRIEMARASVRASKGALLPQLGIGVGGGIRKFGRYTMDGAGNITTPMIPGKLVPIDLPDMYLGLQASWEADIWGKLKNKRKSAFANYLASMEGTNLVISNIVSDIAISYYELLALDNELDIIIKTIKKREDELSVIQFQKETGRANELAVQQFTASLLNSKALEKEVSQQIVEIENRINFLMGRFPQTINRNKEMLFTEPTQAFSAGVPSQLLENRPDIRQAERQLQASKFDLKTAKAAFYPSVNITGSLGFQAFDPSYLFLTPASVAYTALGNLVAPLVNRNALKAQFNFAKANQIEAMYMYQKTILNGYVEVANELSNIKKLQEINTLKKQQSETLIQSTETSTELYKSGRATYLEVLLAQQTSLETRLELVNTTKRQRISAVNIYKALGGGWR